MLASMVSVAFFAACLVAAAVSDMLTMTIPNRLTLCLAAAYPIAALLVGTPPVEMLYHTLAGSMALGVCFIMFALGWLGGGDAKLAAGVALWLGLDLLLSWLLVTAFFGGLLTVFLLIIRQMPLPNVLGTQEWALRLHNPKEGVPYGIAIAAGALWVLPMSQWVKSLS